MSLYCNLVSYVKKKHIYILFLLLFLVVLGGRYRYFFVAFFHEHFVSYNITLPKDKKFIVRSESTHTPQYIKHIIALAFPEYDIVYNNDLKPHLVVKNVYRARNTSMLSELKNHVPYISFSPEKGKMKSRRYRSTGYPLHEFVTFKNSDDNLTYIPFAAYAKNYPEFLNSQPRKHVSLENLKRRHDLIYVYSHCVSVRDNFFTTVSKYLESSHSYGKCVNNQSGRVPGSYNDLSKLYSNYKFVVAMEHAKKKGYLTEKIINAYEANSIPIYWGDVETAREFFNTKSYIDLSSFKNNYEASEYLLKLSKDHKRMQYILSQPILTKSGEMILSVNKKKLPLETQKFLAESAKKIRKKYIKSIRREKLF